MQDNLFKNRILTDLQALQAQHLANFIAKDVCVPLSIAPFSLNGLLNSLPHRKGKSGWPWDTEVAAEQYESRCDWPKISVVIPSFNQAEFLEEAIRSVLLQNYPNMELIVMDGGSNDGSRDILTLYSTWISYWQSEKDKGQGHAVNMGMSIASGNYLGWLNSDDFYNEKAFFILGEEIIQSARNFYYGDGLVTDRLNTNPKRWQAFLVKDMFLRFGGLIASHSAFWSKMIHQPVWEELNCNVDGELWIRLVNGSSRKHIKFPIGTVRLYEDTKSAHEKWKSKWREDDLNIERLHGSPPRARSVLAYLFRILQHIYRQTLR